MRPALDSLENGSRSLKRPVQRWKNQNPGVQGLRKRSKTDSVTQSVRDNPDLSIRKRAVALNVHRSSLFRILHKDLKLHPYKIQLVQELKPQDAGQRLEFINRMIERFPTLTNILF
ncbi:hypothetical protein EVAR_13855_1 [Eumeta japonica]|uniref:HTH psq-type domain-containing protein n=1 Tax=Eumeta variegata TaxID=151549 RepID=A0A4C1U138_EUMVA|nr:hypothetical protein EVAR_13855_1 [Eumeta japonica]